MAASREPLANEIDGELEGELDCEIERFIMLIICVLS